MKRPDLTPQMGEGKDQAWGCLVAIIIFVLFGSIVGFSIIFAPSPTKEQLEKFYKDEREGYIKWCKSINGEAVFDAYKRPKACNTRKD